MEKHLLSKSTFIKGLQCLKALYLYKNYYHLKDPVPPERQAIFDRGHQVGELAQQLFPGGVDCTPSKRFRYRESIEKTQRLINEGQEVIYEATFQVDQVLVMMDILVRRGDSWYAYEVKSSTRISDTYLTDAAIQYYVITNSGLPLADISIVHIDNQYTRKKQLDLIALFKITSVKDKIITVQPDLNRQIKEMKAVIFNHQMPERKIGAHCYSPYPCDYLGYCWGNDQNAEIFSLAGSGKASQIELFEKGYRNFKEIPDTERLTNSQKIQIAGKPILNLGNLQKFLRQVQFPLWFLDFETVQYAIPKYEGVKPYQQIPFQFSLHRMDEEGTVTHTEFLAEPGLDPRLSFAEALFHQVGETGSVIVYNATFEKMVIGALRNWFPHFEKQAENMVGRFVDLMYPFQQKDYYLPEMEGSHSIKSVLPAVCPEMSYEGLSINNGYLATMAYNELQTSSDMFKIQEVKQDLLDYCKLDTLAMVKIYEKLQEVTQ